MPPNSIEVREEYIWSSQDLLSLQAAVHGLKTALATADEKAEMNVRVSWAGPPKTELKDSQLETLLGTRQEGPERIVFDYYDTDVRIWVSTDLNRGQLDCQLTVPFSSQDTAAKALTQFQSTLQLERYDRERSNWKQTERSFESTIQDPARLLAGLQDLEPFHAGDARFSGSIEALDGQRESYDRRLSEWKESVSKDWGTSRRITWRFSSQSAETYFDLDIRRGILRFSAAGNPERSASIQGAFSKAFEGLLTPFDDTYPTLIGFRRRYLLKDPLDVTWLRKAVDTVELVIPQRENFNGSYRLSSGSEDISLGKLDVWQARVEQEWDDLLDARFYASSRKRRLDFALSMNQSFVEIMIDARSEDEAKAELDRVANALNLEQTSKPPRPVWRTKEDYAVGLLNRADLSECIENTIRYVFGTRQPQVQEASIQSAKEADEQKAYSSVEGFLKALGADDPIKEFHLILNGRALSGLSLHYFQPKDLLEVRTSVEPAKFKEIDKFLTKKLGAKPKPEADEAKKDGEKDKEKPSDGTFIKVVFPIVMLLLGSILTPAFLGAYSPKTQLKITLPAPVKAGEEVKLKGRTFTLAWQTTRERFFQSHSDSSSQAMVKVFRNGETLTQTKTMTPGALTLDKGSYTIQVTDPDSNSLDQVRVAVP